MAIDLVKAFRKQLIALHGIKFKIDDGGLVYQNWLRIDFDQIHESGSEGHIALHVSFNRNDGMRAELFDCVSGIGADRKEMMSTAARIWCSTTAPAIFELFSQDGKFAGHYPADDDEGVRGWHTIWGPMLGYGLGDSGTVLQEWALQARLLPQIGALFAPNLASSVGPHGIKILFGGDDIAEVRVNGEVDETSSDALLRMDWPRLNDFGVLRSYLILVHKN